MRVNLGCFIDAWLCRYVEAKGDGIKVVNYQFLEAMVNEVKSRQQASK